MKEYKVTIDKIGTISYYKPGTDIIHRGDGPAVARTNGTKMWYINGKRHRENGPAVEWANGTKMWYINGELHREDGPAIDWPDGIKYWYIDGVELTEQEFNDLTKVVELSLEDIATKFNVNVNNLKIKK